MKCLRLLLCPAALLAAAAGCLAKPSPPAKPAAPPAAAPGSAFSNTKVTATQSHAVYDDPKTGKIAFTADFAYSVAQSVGKSNDVHAAWHDVHGVIYQNGVRANKFSAPIVVADNELRTVTASGGVAVTSITQADTSVRCDRMTWYMNKNLLIGVGHAVLRKGGFMQSAPSFQADTHLKSIVMPAPGLSGGARRPIHARIER